MSNQLPNDVHQTMLEEDFRKAAIHLVYPDHYNPISPINTIDRFLIDT